MPAADTVHGATGLVQPGPQLNVVGAGVLVRPQVEEEGNDLWPLLGLLGVGGSGDLLGDDPGGRFNRKIFGLRFPISVGNSSPVRW